MNASVPRILYTTVIGATELIMVFPFSRPGFEQQIIDLANLSISGKGDWAGPNRPTRQIALRKEELRLAAISLLSKHDTVCKPKRLRPCGLVEREAQQDRPAHDAATSLQIQTEYNFPNSNTQQRIALTCFRCFAQAFNENLIRTPCCSVGHGHSLWKTLAVFLPKALGAWGPFPTRAMLRRAGGGMEIERPGHVEVCEAAQTSKIVMLRGFDPPGDMQLTWRGHVRDGSCRISTSALLRRENCWLKLFRNTCRAIDGLSPNKQDPTNTNGLKREERPAI